MAFKGTCKVFDLSDSDMLRNVALSLERDAMTWYQSTLNFQAWTDFETSFRKEFGKSKIDLDIVGLSRRLNSSAEPRQYINEILSYVTTANPHATESNKIDSNTSQQT